MSSLSDLNLRARGKFHSHNWNMKNIQIQKSWSYEKLVSLGVTKHFILLTTPPSPYITVLFKTKGNQALNTTEALNFISGMV